jgi:prepilin-type N-terminal cleavage/methylation domain-containing protein/prepilin-type processing-associated H-X9-DG protein
MSKSRGFTVIELMVVILIIAVLLSLIVPAVQQARESARRSQCICNLKMLALATANYESVHGVFPFGVGGGTPPGEGRVPRWSTHSQILPWMEQAPLFNAINFSGVAWLSDPVFGPPNATALETRIHVFICPSDDESPDPYSLGHNSYRGCAGTKAYNLASDSPDGTGKNDGMFWFQSAVKVTSITDGTGHTALFSERCMGSPTWPDVRADYLMTPPDLPACQAASATNADRYRVPHELSGLRWGDGALFYTRYNHILLPNRQSCLLGGSNDYESQVIVTASSRHPGGVNVTTADGAVRFVKDTIQREIWKLMATIAGGEVICDDGAY